LIFGFDAQKLAAAGRRQRLIVDRLQVERADASISSSIWPE
jgi:hypothetical protein